MTRTLAQKLLTLFLALAITPLSLAATEAPPKVLGWIEEGVLMPEKATLKIKLDTGALTSSLDAKDLERFDKNGEQWVRFNVDVKDSKTGKQTNIPFERKIERNVKVRGAGGSESRPVVKMSLCIGDQVYHEQFSLKDRGDMLYPVLIGRRTLEHLGAVDVSRTFTQEPSCNL